MKMRSPGMAMDFGMWGNVAYCERELRAMPTPALPHAYVVRPEQSKATPGELIP